MFSPSIAKPAAPGCPPKRLRRFAACRRPPTALMPGVLRTEPLPCAMMYTGL